MIVKDKVYGAFEIEDVFIELINSEPVQRLKGIHQGGASYLVNKKWDNNRYDHSIGVMLLIRKLDGSIEEQIAGLLHDISHTAFSHVIDFVFENTEEDYHEEIYTRIVEDSEIPKILNNYGYNYKSILLNLEKWKILENPIPELCADRIDYTLRDLLHHGAICKQEVDNFIKSIEVKNDSICIESIKSAEWFVKIYQQLIFEYFMHPLNIYGYDLLSNTLKLALQKRIITLDDLLKDDKNVICILRNCNDKEVQQILNKINPKVRVEENEEDYHIHRKNKLRIVDPLVNNNGKLERASKLSNIVNILNEKARIKAEKGVYVKILK